MIINFVEHIPQSHTMETAALAIPLVIRERVHFLNIQEGGGWTTMAYVYEPKSKNAPYRMRYAAAHTCSLHTESEEEAIYRGRSALANLFTNAIEVPLPSDLTFEMQEVPRLRLWMVDILNEYGHTSSRDTRELWRNYKESRGLEWSSCVATD